MLNEIIYRLISTIDECNYEDAYELDKGIFLCLMLHPQLIYHLTTHTELYNADNDMMKTYTDEFIELKNSIAKELYEQGKLSLYSYNFL